MARKWRTQYGIYERGCMPAELDQWRRSEALRVAQAKRARLERFESCVAGWLTQIEKPSDISGARRLLVQAQESGALPAYELTGDLWLARLLGRCGLRIEVKRRLRPAGLTRRELELLRNWWDDCLVVGIDQFALSDLRKVWHWWTAAHRYDVESDLGPRKMMSWLRSEGLEITRHARGTIVKGVDWRIDPRTRRSMYALLNPQSG